MQFQILPILLHSKRNNQKLKLNKMNTFTTKKRLNIYDGSYQISSVIIDGPISNDYVEQQLIKNELYRKADYWAEVTFNATITRYKLNNIILEITHFIK